MIALAARVVLAAVFAVAAGAKARDHRGTRTTAIDLGVPASIAAVVAALLPIVEAIIAIALVVPITAPWAATVAIGLLEGFSIATAANDWRGRHVRCACFGTLLPPEADTPRWTIARNLAMALLAAIVLREGGLPWTATFATTAIGGGALAIALVAVWIGTRSVADDVPVSPIGLRAPRLPRRGTGAGRFDARHLARRSRLVVLWSPHCAFSQALLPRLQRWEANTTPDGPALLLVSPARAEDHRDVGLDMPILLDPHSRTARAMSVTGTPAAVLIDADGLIASLIALGAPEVTALLDGAARVAPQPTTAEAGRRFAIGSGILPRR